MGLSGTVAEVFRLRTLDTHVALEHKVAASGSFSEGFLPFFSAQTYTTEDSTRGWRPSNFQSAIISHIKTCIARPESSLPQLEAPRLPLEKWQKRSHGATPFGAIKFATQSELGTAGDADWFTIGVFCEMTHRRSLRLMTGARGITPLRGRNGRVRRVRRGSAPRASLALSSISCTAFELALPQSRRAARKL
jgi:hypothetical protein